MNKTILKGDWNLIKGTIKEKWGKLTEDDLMAINGKRDQLLGAIQKKYGIAKEIAEEQICEWEKQCSHGYNAHDDLRKERENDQYAKQTHKY